MKQRQLKSVNVNELQSNVSHIIKDVESGQVYRVMRYSQPAAVLIPYEDYENLKGECKQCVGEIKKDLKAIAEK